MNKLSQNIACIILLIVVAVLHKEPVLQATYRQMALYCNARDGLLETPKYQCFSEEEFIDTDQSLKRILFFQSRDLANDSKNLNRIVITDANYQEVARLELRSTTKIHSTAVIKNTHVPIFEIIRYRPAEPLRVIVNFYAFRDGEIVPLAT